MKIFVNKDIKRFFQAISAVLTAFLFLIEVSIWLLYRDFSLWLLLLCLLTAGTIWAICFWYFNRQNKIMENAVSQINAYLAGDVDARIECDNEGELYRLFHSVNSLAAVLNAHAANELREKEFLKNTISDISHQLKTPLAALNIYNGLLQDEAEELPAVKEFATLSEQELDRIETLVQNLLKITKLDAGSIVIEKNMENVANMMRDVELHFVYRARQEPQFKQLWASLSRPAFFWLLAGGIFYTVGGVIYALKLPIFNARHRFFGSHEIFHLFVMGGSFCHYMMMYGYLAAA